MDFLARTYKQASDLLKSMSPASRMIAVLLLVTIVTSFGFLVSYTYQGGGSYLFGGHEFSERDLQNMEAAFAKAGLKRWKRVGNRLRIPRGQEHAYVAALADGNALPRDFNSIFDEMTAKANPFESPRSREMRAKMLKQKYLSMVVANLPGVDDATVQFDETSTGGFARRKEKTAMVAVRGKGSTRLSQELVESVRYTVASAVAGLEPEHVTVTDLVQGRAYPGQKQLPAEGGISEYARQKQVYENYWKEKISEALAVYSGAVVAVNVDLDPKTKQSTNKVTYDPRPTPLETSTSSKKMESTQNGGRPGTDPNLVVANQPRSVAAGSAKTTTQDEQSEEQRAVAGYEHTVTDSASLVPKLVSASIGIPRSYLIKVWKKKNPPASGQPPTEPSEADLTDIETKVLENVENLVVGLLPPVPPGQSGFDQVQVAVYDDFEPPPPESEGMVAKVGSWFASNWQTLAMLGLGGFGLLMFRSMVRSSIPDEPLEPSPAATLAAVGESEHIDEESGGTEGVVSLKRFRSTGPDLRAELANMVKEDPDAAAAILRSWIGDAA